MPEQKLRSHLGSLGITGNLALQPMYTLSGMSPLFILDAIFSFFLMLKDYALKGTIFFFFWCGTCTVKVGILFELITRLTRQVCRTYAGYSISQTIKGPLIIYS